MIAVGPRRRQLLLAAATVLLAGCAIEQRRVQLPPVARPAVSASLDCALTFTGIREGRSRQRIRGPSWHIYDIDNAVAYLDSGIRALLGVSDSAAEEQAAPLEAPALAEPLRVELVRAYAQGKAMRGFYNVVMTVRIGARPPRVVRGRYDVTNWFGSGDEFATGMQLAMDDALVEMERVLADSDACTGGAHPA